MSSDLYLPDLAELGLTDLGAEMWLTRGTDGALRPIRVDDMTPDHRAHVLRWVRDNAELLDRQQRRLTALLYRTGAITAAELADRIRVLDESDPRVWVEDTALVRRLVQLADRPGHPPRPRARRLLPARLRYPLGGRP